MSSTQIVININSHNKNHSSTKAMNDLVKTIPFPEPNLQVVEKQENFNKNKWIKYSSIIIKILVSPIVKILVSPIVKFLIVSALIWLKL